MCESFKECVREALQHKGCVVQTFDMETGALLARDFFNPVKGQSIRLPTPALPNCSPSADSRSIRSVFWYSEIDPAPANIVRLLAPRPVVVVRGGRVGVHPHGCQEVNNWKGLDQQKHVSLRH